MRGGLIFVFTISALFFLLGLALAGAWAAADPRFYLGDRIPPLDCSEIDSAEEQLRSQIAENDRLVARLKENIAELPMDVPPAQRAVYMKRLTDSEAKRTDAMKSLTELDALRETQRTHRIERLNNARVHTLTRGIFLLVIGMVGMVRFREAITRRSVR